ncbi:MAG: mechanosensitive ion channel [Clostridia bacterium]|nr:mechanosensitive ion channel [Clostridia bacterium]
MDAVVAAFSELKTSLGINLGNFTLSNILPAVIVFLIGWIIVRILLKIVNNAVDRLNVEKSLHTFIKSTIKIVLYFILLIIVLGVCGIPITSLVAVLSVAGLAVSLAVQGSLSNLAGGITILLTKPFKVDDFIETADGSGTVIDIGLFYTTLSTPDKRDIFIPNGNIVASKIMNYSKEENRKVSFKFSASYDADIDLVKKAILKAFSSDKRVLSDPAPFVNVNAYLDSSIEYVAWVWVKNSDYWDVYWYMMEEVKREFDRNKIEMTYNHLNVHMIKDN